MLKTLTAACAALAILTGCATTTAGTGDQDPVLFTKNETVVVVEGEILSKDQRKALNEYLAQAEYHGAFVINPLRQSWHWFDNTASVFAATSLATGACEHRTRGLGSCIVYAVTYPVTTDGRRGTAVGVSQRGAERIREMIGRTAPGNTSVMAQTQLGVSRYAINYPNAANARTDAMERCKRGIDSYRARFDPAEWALLTKNLSTSCQIVWSYSRKG